MVRPTLNTCILRPHRTKRGDQSPDGLDRSPDGGVATLDGRSGSKKTSNGAQLSVHYSVSPSRRAGITVTQETEEVLEMTENPDEIMEQEGVEVQDPS